MADQTTDTGLTEVQGDELLDRFEELITKIAKQEAQFSKLNMDRIPLRVELLHRLMPEPK